MPAYEKPPAWPVDVYLFAFMPETAEDIPKKKGGSIVLMQNYGNQRKQAERKKRPVRASTKPAYRIRNYHRPKIHRALFSHKMQREA